MPILRKLRFVSGVAVLALAGSAGVAAAASNSQSDQQSMGDVPFTGPLQAANATTLPAGHWDIEPYLVYNTSYAQYDDHWHKRNTGNSHTLLSATLFQYGVADNFSVGLIPQFAFFNHPAHGANSSGIRMGDTTLRLQYMFHQFHKGSSVPTVGVVVDQNLPTGDYDGLSKTANGFGSGIWSTDVTLATQDYFWMPNGHIVRTRFNVSYEFADGSRSVNGRSVYGTNPGFSGRVHAADTATVDVSAEYALTRHWAPVFEMVYQYQGTGRVTGTNAHGALSTTHFSAGQSLSIDPAIEYLWNGHFGLIVGAEYTVAGRNTGASITPQAALNMFF